MPINQTANLLAYFEQNTPASSLAQAPVQLTYPPIPGIIVSPFSTLPISGISTLNSPAQIGAFIPPVFAEGVPGSIVFNDSYTSPNGPAIPNNPMAPTPEKTTQTPVNPMTSTGYFNPNGSLLALGDGVSVPPNNMSPLSALAEGSADTYKEITSAAIAGETFRASRILSLLDTDVQPKKVPAPVNFFDPEGNFQSGFTFNRKHLDPSEFVGVVPNAPYNKPLTANNAFELTYANKFNSATIYTADNSNFIKFEKVDSEVNLGGITDFTLKGLYEQYSFNSIKTKYGDRSGTGPYITRGIQAPDLDFNTNNQGNNYSNIDDVVTEHKSRLEYYIENNLSWQKGFKERRKKNQIFQMQSRFHLNLGFLPHIIGGGPYNLKQDLKLKKTNLLDLIASKAWIKGGTIARVPHHLVDYSLLNSLGIKYGLGSRGDLIFNGLSKLFAKFGQVNEDLIPFYFKVTHKKTPYNGALFNDPDGSKPGLLQFRGTLKTLSHSVTPQWSSKKYFGRPDSVHTYSGFSQNLAFSFSLYAMGRPDMVEMYEKLNELISLCKPAWTNNNSMMKGPITELTIGDWMVNQPGFIASLSITPDEQIYWDLGKDPIKALPQILQVLPQGAIDTAPVPIGNNFQNKIQQPGKVPRAFQISITYTMIEKEIPDADGTPFWNYTKAGKSFLL